MSQRISRLAVAALVLPLAAFGAGSITFQYLTYNTGNLSGTVTLNAGQAVNLETGAAVSSGGDLSWDGTKLTPVGKSLVADLAALGLTGTTGYSEVNQALLQEGLAAGLGGTSAVTPAQSDVIGVLDNSGNVAKMLITALASSGGGGTTSGGPAITAIQNNYSYLVPGLPNYGIAPGALFIIKGSGMANATTVSALNDPSKGLPTSWNGVSISITVGGVTASAPIYYAIATQIAAVLPSNLPAGTGTLTLSYNGTATASITVLGSALGLDTYYGTGTGLGVATNASTGALYSYTSSIPPGTTVVLWGSGLGNTGDSDTTNTSTPHAVSNPPTFYIGGIAVTPLYAGRSAYPGVDQINLTIPSSVTPGCGVSVVAVSGSTVSNTVTLPVAAGGGVCTDSVTGQNGTTLSNLAGKSNINAGTLFVFQETDAGQTQGVGFGEFQNVVTTTSSTVSGVTSIGSCTMITAAGTSTSVTTSTGLDAGTITLTGPAGSQTLASFSVVPGAYEAQLPSGFIPASGGSFTFKGSGGANVGAFSVSVSYTNPLVWSNSGAISSVTRASGQTVTWTGGASGSYVYIGGSSSNSQASGNFVCYAPASAGTFTVPSYVLLGLPAGNGTLTLENITTPVSFTASGLDYGTAFAGVSIAISPTYQ